MQIEFRKAGTEEYDQIYRMGFDAWADGDSEEEYLTGCRNSPKYKKGTWFVLSVQGQLVSSLIVYQFDELAIGIGSIATPLDLRGKGYASKLISSVLDTFEHKNSETTFFLYSDINPEFYEKFGFHKVNSDAQRYKTTTCMIRGKDIQGFLTDKEKTPEYF